MPSILSLALRLALAVLLPFGVAAQDGPDSAAFVTRLGVDTLVLERFVRTPLRIDRIHDGNHYHIRFRN